ncbi:hypothetical protein NHX12_029963, partial [Muraenolepis orangiensis]
MSTGLVVRAEVASGGDGDGDSPAGCASCGLPALDKDAEERLMIEIAKQQILSKLHLQERPNITHHHAVPRVALLTALRKLHAGRVRQDGTLVLENNIPTKDQGYEIVSFAETEESGGGGNGSSLRLTFQFLHGQSIQVLQSSLWVYARASSRDSRLRARVFLTYGAPGDSGNRTLLTEKTLDVQEGNWHTFTLARPLQAFLDRGQGQLRLEMDYYIKFKDIQWQDWIIAPEGYHMNYCMGQCPQHLAGSPGIASSFHATVFSQLKINGINTAVSSCCVPTERRPLSLMYFNSHHTIVKMDVPDMIVDSCG